MSNSDKNSLSFQKINYADTISQFMEKVNNNFKKIIESNGGPAGVKGDDGDQGVPTKPKVPIHVWAQNEHYNSEYSEGGTFRLDLNGYENELTDVKYQEGHLILLQNAHVYILEVNNDFTLYPRFLLSFQSYNSGDVVDGRPTYVHFAYSKNPDGEGLQTDQELKDNNINQINMPYMGVCSNHNESSPKVKEAYSWMRIQGADGKDGEDGTDGKDGVDGEDGKDGKDGVDGENGDNFTGHSYTIDLEGDMSTISVDVNGYRQYEGDYCECVVHAYYGNDCVDITPEKISVILPDGYSYGEDNKIINKDGNVGEIIKEQSFIENQQVYVVKIQFIPDETFKFPEKTIIFKIHVEAQITDNETKYSFYRDTIWMVKGIVSPFELEIRPERNEIKIADDKYFPEFLKVYVHKVEGSKRDIFNFTEYPDFKLLYKNYDDGDDKWLDYYDPEHPEISTNGIPTTGVVCLEFKVVRYYGSKDPEKPEEIWDYEDVWTIADGKSVHYYHGDLGSTESMMVLVTDETYNYVNSYGDTVLCAKLRNEPADKNGEGEGYSIIFDPKFFDGTEELTVYDVDIYNDNNDEYRLNESFARKIEEIRDDGSDSDSDGNKKYKFTVTRVPAGIDVIPMNFAILAYREENGEIEYFSDTVGFNVYISSLSSTYTLVPTVSAFNTSTGKALKSDSLSDSDSDLDYDSIGCRVYKNNIEIVNLESYGLNLKYTVYGENGNTRENTYSEELVYGEDDDIVKDYFTASDVSIVFILSYGNREIVRSTVPLIKDGKDGEDGDSWQYIFCRSNSWPFDRTGISNPHDWIDNDPKNSKNELLGNEGEKNPNWTPDPQGVGPNFRYEYQAYRKWNKDEKCWGKYGNPTLYSNYSVGGDSNSVNYKAILSNPVAIIPVGNNDFTDDGSDVYKTQSDFTYVYFYDNTSDISTNENIDVEIDKNDVRHNFFEVERDENYNNIWKVSFNPSYEENDEEVYFNFDDNSPFNLPITVTYTIGGDANSDGTTDFFETKIFWTLKPLYNTDNIIEDVEVFVDKTVVNITSSKEHSFRVGYYLSKNGYKKFIENKNVDNIKKYDIILTDNIDNISSKSIEENWQNVTFTFTDNRNCYVVLVDESKNMIDYGVITSVFDGSDGKSPIHLELSQDYIVLPSDETGEYVHEYYRESDGNFGKKIASIKMTLYNGDKEITNDIKYSIWYDNNQLYYPVPNNEGYFDVFNGDIFLDKNSRIHCVATYNGVDYTRDLIIRLTRTPYELEINKGILKRDNNGKIIRSYDEEKLKVAVKSWVWDDIEKNYKWVYTSEGTVYAKGNKSVGRVKLTNVDSDYTNKKEREILLSEFDDKDDTEIKIYFENYNSEEYSYEYIGIIRDGNDGKDGTATHLELTQDHILLPSQETEDGYKVHDLYEEDIQTQMILYSGDKIITSGIDYYFTVNEESVDSITVDTDENKENGKYYGTITIPAELINSDTNIKCTATYNGVSYHKVLFVDLEETPYELVINKNILQRNANSGSLILDDPIITVHVKYWMGGKWYYTNKGNVYFNSDSIAFNKKPEESKPSTSSEGFERTLDLTNLPDEIINSNTPEFRIYYKNSNKIEVSFETLGVINSGKDGEEGTAPICTSSEIIGYALPDKDGNHPKKPEDNEDYKDYVGVNLYWKPSIQYLYGNQNANEMVGKQIFILLKETWENSKTEWTSYKVTVTLAGTQGINGKSRVLFYLGSYRDGTLKTSIPTAFNDFRCDYYIDTQNRAWMRTGTITNGTSSDSPVVATDPTGKNLPTKDWVASEKVGFLQAGAIHADMINTGSITAESGLVDKLKSIDIIADTIAGKTIQSSTLAKNPVNTTNIKIEADGTKNPPTWRLNNDGSGHLSSGNIYWDKYGKLYLGGKNTNDPDVNIGNGAWTVTPNGIRSNNYTAEFNNDGSGQIGGYSDEDLTINKGISWSESGELTFHSARFSNYVEYTPGTTVSKTIDINTINKVFILNPKNQSSIDQYITIYFSDLFNEIKENTVSDIDIINNSDYPVQISSFSSVGGYNIIVPQMIDNFAQNPWLNIGRSTLNGSDTNFIYILPTTYLGVTIMAKKSGETTGNIFIRNISDFMYSDFYKPDKETINKCLVSKLPFYNNLPLTYTKVLKNTYNILKTYNLNISIRNYTPDGAPYLVEVANKIKHEYNGESSEVSDYKKIEESEIHTINILLESNSDFKDLLNNIIRITPLTSTYEHLVYITIIISSYNISFKCELKGLTTNEDFTVSFTENTFQTKAGGVWEDVDKKIYDIIKNLLHQSPNATMNMDIIIWGSGVFSS